MTRVRHPLHYNVGSIECWDYIISHNMNFLQGNIIKYITRYKDKDGLTDLQKAKEYLDKLIQTEYNSKSNNKEEVACVDEKTGTITFTNFP